MEIEDILKRADIVELASKYTDLKEKGGEWWGISPITYPPEKTPSFSCRRETGQFYDFSSGIGGSAITLIQYCEKVSTGRAVELLKKYVNISDDEAASPQRLLSAKVARRFKPRTRSVKQSKSRVLPKDCMDSYEFAVDKFSPWLSEGISLNAIKHFGVRFDRYADRIVFPIKNYSGDIINISGRTLVPDYKEKGIRKYTYYEPLGALDTLYGYSDNKPDILTEKEIILFEGAKSVMLAWGWGVKNTSAILTSHLNDNQIMFLIKLGVNVVFALDKDVDVHKDRNIARLSRYVRVKYVKDADGLLDEKMSPVDKGKEVWKKLYKERRLLA